VAVDARWLERSLNEAYNPWMVKPDGSSPASPVHRFSAHNYLEKIFQIPFSLPAMDQDGYRKLVGDLVETPRAQAGARGQQEPIVDDQADVVIEDQPFQDNQPVGDEATESLHRQANEEQRREQEEQLRRQREQKEREEASKRVEAMLLQENEKLFISALYNFIDTPRLAKRFINIYRLLRVRAATMDDNFSTFINHEQGEYGAVLLLLAISVGRPNVAPEILDDLHRAKGDSFRKWLDDLSKQYDVDGTRGITERIPQKNQIDPSPPSGHESRLAELKEALMEIRGSIDAVEIALKDLNGPPLNDQLPIYCKWAREVGRYSFRWHLKVES
jgi:hypothetical protein